MDLLEEDQQNLNKHRHQSEDQQREDSANETQSSAVVAEA